MGLVEYYKFVELTAFVLACREDTQHDDEQAEGLVFLDPLVAQIDDDRPSRPQEVAEPPGIVDIRLSEHESVLGEPLGGPWQVGFLDLPSESVEGKAIPVPTHNGDELPDVEGIVTICSQEELPAFGSQFGRAELNRLHLDAGIF
ncbi:hypothetical protein D3C86_1307690 [compost metagenome]